MVHIVCAEVMVLSTGMAINLVSQNCDIDLHTEIGADLRDIVVSDITGKIVYKETFSVLMVEPSTSSLCLSDWSAGGTQHSAWSRTAQFLEAELDFALDLAGGRDVRPLTRTPSAAWSERQILN